MAKRNVVVQGEMKDELTGQCLELIRQIRQKGGCPSNPWALKRELQRLVETKFSEWPKEVKVADLNDSLVVVCFDEVKPRAEPRWVVSALRSRLGEMGLEPAEMEDLITYTEEIKFQAIHALGYMLLDIVAIGKETVVYGYVSSKIKIGERLEYTPYKFESIGALYLLDERRELGHNYPMWFLKKKFTNWTCGMLWFLAKRKTTTD